MAAGIEYAPRQHETEQISAPVLWMTTGLSCKGDSVAMTSATNASLEDIVQGVIPGMPRLVVHNQVIAVEVGDEYMQAWCDAEQGKLHPFVLVVEGSVGNEQISGEGHWTGFGVNRSNGQPITLNEWIDRLAPKAAAVVAAGTCATYGGIPAMKNNPTGAIGVPDYLGWKWRSRAGLPVIDIPGCPAQPDNTTQVLVYLGCKGPVVKRNLPVRGWSTGSAAGTSMRSRTSSPSGGVAGRHCSAATKSAGRASALTRPAVSVNRRT